MVRHASARGTWPKPCDLTCGDAGLPEHFTVHSFRVGGSLTRSLASKTVEQIMQMGGLKTEAIARYNVEPSSAGAYIHRRKQRTLVGGVQGLYIDGN